MINFFLITLLIHCIVYKVYGKKTNVLACGLFGFISDDPMDFSKSKFNVLGILNEKRGVHSCGVSYDNEIYHGVFANKVWRDFSDNNVNATPTDLNNTVVIGHTRWATGGAHNTSNAHPFGFGTNEDGGYEMVGAHNGSLFNKEAIAAEFDVELKDKNRDKIDSEILLEAIYKNPHRIKEILEFYEGAAALMWYYADEPNTIFMYHGKSSTYKGYTHQTEERPMYYYQENFTRAVYFSSIEQSLNLINDDDGEVIELPFNQVIVFKDGQIQKNRTYDIDRSNQYHKKEKPVTSYTTRSYGSNFSAHTTYTNKSKGTNNTKSLNATNNRTSTSSNYVFPNLKNTIDTKGNFTMEKFRYNRYGALLNGVFTPLLDDPLFRLGSTKDEALKSFEKVALNRRYQDEPLLLYFYNGILLKDRIDYNYCMSKDSSILTMEKLSHMSVNPICSIIDKNPLLHYEGKYSTNSFIPFLSDKIVTTNFGKITHVKEAYADYQMNKPFMSEISKKVYNLIEDYKEDSKDGNQKDSEYVSIMMTEILEEMDTYEEDAAELLNSGYNKGILADTFKKINENIKTNFEKCLNRINSSQQLAEK